MSQADNPALRALLAMDLTNLDDDCTSDDIRNLVKNSRTRHGTVAALCVWPKFVRQAAGGLNGSNIGIATVVNFPGGDHPARDVIDMTKEAVACGATEIDVVVPWKMLMEGHPENISARVARVKTAADGACVKAIIESGMLRKPDLIREATRCAIDGGADFVKTSTGKVPVNATPEAARIILEEIATSGKPVGLKVAGGIRTTEDAVEYLAIADEIMGHDWATPTNFRIGGSSLLPALLKSLSADN